MARVTSKLQLTLPRRMAEKFGIQPGDEIHWVASAGGIRIVPGHGTPAVISRADKLALFDDSVARQQKREVDRRPSTPTNADRGWSREDLYNRGGPR